MWWKSKKLFVQIVQVFLTAANITLNLAKLDDGLAESPTVMVVDNKTRQDRKNRAKIEAY